MTVIVYRDGIMAADSVAWTANNSVKIPCLSKITRISDGSMLGCCGASSDIDMVKEHLLNHGTKPSLEKGDFNALWLKADGTLWLVDHNVVPFQIEHGFFAIGAPAEFAFGALYAGASAHDTVKLCVDHTDGAGGAVQVEKLCLTT